MSPLATIIQNHGLPRDPDTISEFLSELVIIKEDHTRYTSAMLAKLFGVETLGLIDETLKATPGYDWVRLLLAGAGIDFADSTTITGLTNLKQLGLLSEQVVDALLSVGIVKDKKHKILGLSNLPTNEEISTAINEITEAQTKASFVNYFNSIVNDYSISDIKSLIGQWEPN